MALSSRSYPLERIEDPAVREVLRILFDRIHDLETANARGIKLAADLDAAGHRIVNLGAAAADGDAVSRVLGDDRYVRT